MRGYYISWPGLPWWRSVINTGSSRANAFAQSSREEARAKIQSGIIEEKGENRVRYKRGQDFQGSKPGRTTSSLAYDDLCGAGNIAGRETIAFSADFDEEEREAKMYICIKVCFNFGLQFSFPFNLCETE